MQRIRSHLHLFDIFEVAARHSSFKGAATELNLSPSAVSHQVKSLETQLGSNLFIRQPGKVSLNHKGKCLYEQLQPIFQQLDRIKPNNLNHDAIRILVPLLFPESSIQQLKGLSKELGVSQTIEVDEIIDLQQLRTEDFDFAFRIGSGCWPDFTAVELSHSSTQLVAHQDFVEKHQLQNLQNFDPKAYTFLYGEDHKRFLKQFPQAINLERDRPKHQYFAKFSQLLDALVAGKGYSDLFVQVIQPYLDSGVLVPLVATPRRWREKIYLVYHKDRELSELDLNIIRLFKDFFA